MSRDIWLISDTHFQHENILSFVDFNGELIRGKIWTVIEEMDEQIIQNWNATVKDGDIVYHLGDVFVGCKERFLHKWNRLKGKKRLIVGNHDDVKFFAKTNCFQKILMWRQFKEFGIILSHVPLHESTLYRYDKMYVNVHGHIHQNLSPSEYHKNVCVENTNYFPVNIETVRNNGF